MLSKSQLIIQNLLYDKDYLTRVIPYLKEDYFEDKGERSIFRHISQYVDQYNSPPTTEAVFISLSEDKKITETDANLVDIAFSEIKDTYHKQSMDWLVKETQAFCEEKALENAIYKAIAIIEGQEKKLNKGIIPDLVKDALSISFDTSLGHDYLDDAERRYEYYHRQDIKVPFDLDYLNRITKNGFSKKTLNIFLAGTHVGKTALMTHLAASNLKDGKNVLYISLEISEEEISKRIDANLMDLEIDDVLLLPRDQYMSKINRIKGKFNGKLKVKEYGMSSAHVGHFRQLLNEYKLKQKFFPDIIYIDYLNICASARLKADANSYTLMKAVSEELRALASEFDIPIVTASQFNREGASNSDPGMGSISESFAVNFGADFIAAIVTTDELKTRGMVLLKQLKNRYDDMNRIPKFFLGFDRSKMKFYDIDDPEKGITEPEYENAPFDSSSSAEKFGSFKF